VHAHLVLVHLPALVEGGRPRQGLVLALPGGQSRRDGIGVGHVALIVY
jgi:hypothetical protein